MSIWLYSYLNLESTKNLIFLSMNHLLYSYLNLESTKTDNFHIPRTNLVVQLLKSCQSTKNTMRKKLYSYLKI